MKKIIIILMLMIFLPLNTNAEKITVDGITYTYCPAASGVNSIIWTKNSYVYHIDGSLSAENLIKIAKNIN